MGLTTTTAAAILAFNALMASAQSGWSCDCDGLFAPVWKDCETIVSTLDNPPLEYTAGSDQLPCTFISPKDVDPDSLNCVVGYCKREGVAQGDIIKSSDIKINYSTVTSTCRAQDGTPGGECGPTGPVDSDNKVTVFAKANPNYTGGARRREIQPLTPVSETLVFAQPPEEAKREHARDFARELSKRQSDDETFEVLVTSRNVVNRNGGRIRVFGPSPSGATYKVENTQAQTSSVSSSASLGVSFFEIFEASVDIEVGFEDTVEETMGYELVIDCPTGQDGVLYWTPLYTRYVGLYQPSGEQAEWYVANGGEQSSYELQCIG
jgi:hypothetical protein